MKVSIAHNINVIHYRKEVRDMLNGVFQELDRYGCMIEFLASGSKDMKEIAAYLKGKGVPESTVRGQINNIKDGKTVLIVWKEPSTLKLNYAVLENAVEMLGNLLKMEKISIGENGVGASYSNIGIGSKDTELQIDGLKKEVDDLKAVISQRDATIKAMIEKENALSKELEEAMKKTLELPVVLVSTEEILPEVSAWEEQFVSMHKKGIVLGFDDEEQEEATQDESSQEQPEKKEGFILNYANYVKRGIKKMFTKTFMERRVKKLLEQKGQTEFVSDKQYVNNILREPSFTNQQKLAMYAAFSEYRHSDFEKLLNFAGDNGIDANLLIQWVECLGDELDYLQIKNALRQFAKPTEYKLKYDLAKELLLGVWQVEFYKNGVPTRFRLIAEPDIEMIREKLGLSESAFTYIDFETYEEVKENNEEKK